MDTFIGNMQAATEMHLHRTIMSTNPLVLQELSCRIDALGDKEVADFGRTITVDYPSLAKRIKLATTSVKVKVVLEVTVERYISGSDHRDGIAKYFKTIKERAVAAINGELFEHPLNESSDANVIINMSTELPEIVTLDYIDNLANNIREV